MTSKGRGRRPRALCISGSELSGGLDAGQEAVDLAAEVLGVARQLLGGSEDLGSGRTRLPCPTLHVEARDLNVNSSSFSQGPPL